MMTKRLKIAGMAAPFLLLLLVLAASCGTDPGEWSDSDEASLFKIDGLVQVDTFDVFEPFDDFGCDGEEASPPDTMPDADGSEGNAWPDPCAGEGSPLFMTDMVKFTFSNTARPGVETPVDLYLSRMVVTYRDGNGDQRDFAPQRQFYLGGKVPANGTLELTTVVDDLAYKWGVFDAMETATSEAEWLALWTWDLKFTVYAKEILSGEEYVTRGALTVVLNNPQAEE